jgi:hypothetical protein
MRFVADLNYAASVATSQDSEGSSTGLEVIEPDI